MLKFLQDFRRQGQIKKQLLAFWSEVDKNLERYYVMDQRQFIDQEFGVSAWEGVKGMPEIGMTSDLELYLLRLNEFNAAYRDYKEYERWYVADVNNKNPENAKALHTKKHDLDKKLVRLDLVITPVRIWLYRKLKEMKIVKE